MEEGDPCEGLLGVVVRTESGREIMKQMTTSEMRVIDGGRWRCSGCGRTYWFWISGYNCASGHNRWILPSRWGWPGAKKVAQARVYWVWW